MLEQNKEVDGFDRLTTRKEFRKAFAGLNAQQKKAVETIERPVLVRVTGRF